ncbi:MAG: hypothetical protein NTZ73_04370 [Candidatus Diapherotrites archaeon]|nr:hypothetical protein [Candidatus Diapherotrites archaeon]
MNPSPASNSQNSFKLLNQNSLGESTLNLEMTPDLAEVCGIHAGDGYLRNRNNRHFELDISGNVDEKEYYDEHVVPLFERVFGIKIKPKFFPHRNTYGFLICNRKVCEFMHSQGFPYGKKTLTVAIPEQILNSRNLDVIYGFLRGLFDTDGTIYFKKRGGSGYREIHKKRHTYPIICVGICSKELCDGVGKLLINTGFQFSMSRQIKGPINHDSYRLSIMGDQNIILWMHNIGFKNNMKYNRFLIWKRFGFMPPNLVLKNQKNILSGVVNPNEFYEGPVIDSEKILPKIVGRRLALMNNLNVPLPKD